MVISGGAGKQDSGQFGLHLGISQIGGPFFGHNNNIPWGQIPFMASEKLPEEPLNPVAPGGLAHFAPGHQPQPGAFALPRGQADAKMRRVQSFSPCLGPEVLPAAAKPLVSGKAGRLKGCSGVTDNVSLVGGLGGMVQRGSLYLTPRGASGPWPGGAAKSGNRPWCACVSESHGCEPGAVYSAEKYVSWKFFLGDNFSHKLFINHFSGDLSRTRKPNSRELSDLTG